jgi:hypothetical protein
MAENQLENELMKSSSDFVMPKNVSSVMVASEIQRQVHIVYT